MEWQLAPDINKQIKILLRRPEFKFIPPDRLKIYRSYGSKARARARIWGFPKIWQLALNLSPVYVIEVLSEKFDYLPAAEKTKVLIHELTHIPKNFSGSLLPHWRRLFKNL